MLEHLTRDDDVERVVGEGQVFLDVGPDRFDVESLGRALERFVVDIDADDGVAGRVVLRQRTGATAEIEDVESRAADQIGDQVCSLVGAEDEFLPSTVMRAVSLVKPFEPAHRLCRTHPAISITARLASSAIRKSHGTR